MTPDEIKTYIQSLGNLDEIRALSALDNLLFHQLNLEQKAVDQLTVYYKAQRCEIRTNDIALNRMALWVVGYQSISSAQRKEELEL